MRNVSLIIFITVLIIPQFSLSQSTLDYGNEINYVKLCNYVQSNSFSSNNEAETILDQILRTVGAEKRFVLKPCNNINNAVALQLSGIRYIFYDPDFIKNISSGESWVKFFVLAHEVGHHINGHVVDINSFGTKNISLNEKRLQELESDKFAGFVLSKLGASLKQTLAAVSQFSNSDDTYSTHPNRDKRLLAIQEGFNKGKSIESIYTKSKSDLLEELYYKSLTLYDAENQILAYTFLIQNNSNLPFLHYHLGEAHYELGEYNSAVNNYKYEIRLNPNMSRAYYGLGNAYNKLRLSYQAILNYQISVNLMESGEDYEYRDSYQIPNSDIIIWAYCAIATNVSNLRMDGFRGRLPNECQYAYKAFELNKNKFVLTADAYKTLFRLVKTRCR